MACTARRSRVLPALVCTLTLAATATGQRHVQSEVFVEDEGAIPADAGRPARRDHRREGSRMVPVRHHRATRPGAVPDARPPQGRRDRRRRARGAGRRRRGNTLHVLTGIAPRPAPSRSAISEPVDEGAVVPGDERGDRAAAEDRGTRAGLVRSDRCIGARRRPRLRDGDAVPRAAGRPPPGAALTAVNAAGHGERLHAGGGRSRCAATSGAEGVAPHRRVRHHHQGEE